MTITGAITGAVIAHEKSSDETKDSCEFCPPTEKVNSYSNTSSHLNSQSQSHPHLHSNPLIVLEQEVVKIIVIAAIVIFAGLILSKYAFFISIPLFNEKFAYPLFLLAITVIINAAVVLHIKSFEKFSCQTGMMIGMTVGMTSGFMLSMILGMTNGMAIGTIVGVIAGVAVGAYAGNCCGVMGVMEGIMAGLMGGAMGAMISVMTLNDHMYLIVTILFLGFIAVLIGLMRLIYDETKTVENTAVKNKPVALSSFVTICFFITAVISWLMIYGPKSLLFK